MHRPTTLMAMALTVQLAAAAAAQAASPASGWQRIVDLKNHCRMDVPAGWSNSKMKWFPKSPDHSASAAITTSRTRTMDVAHQQVNADMNISPVQPPRSS